MSSAGNNVWVIAFDPVTRSRADFVCCPPANAAFYAEKFKLEGYEVRTLDGDEVEELIKSGKG